MMIIWHAYGSIVNSILSDLVYYSCVSHTVKMRKGIYSKLYTNR